MQIQPISTQPKFCAGKVHCLSNRGLTKSSFIEKIIEKQIPQLNKLIDGKPFDLYITQNIMQSGIFFNVTPGTSAEPVFQGERYRVNVSYKCPEAIVAAAKEVIKIYEEGIEIPLIKNFLRNNKHN